MESCILCFGVTSENSYFQLDQCFHFSENAQELIQKHFSNLVDKIFITTPKPELTFICDVCWNRLKDFHEFYNFVASNYVHSDVQVKVELEDYEVPPHKQEYFGFAESFQTFEDFKNPDILKTDSKKSRQNRKVKKNSRNPAKKQQTDPEDDDKIRKIADMSCDHCDAKFTTMADASAHYRNEHKISGYLKCCDRKFNQRWKLLDHINNVHYNVSYTCEICGKRFCAEIYLRRHRVVHEMSKDFVCDRCGKCFLKKYLLRTHLLTVHANDNTFPSVECTFEGCDKLFINEARLKQHLKYYHVDPKHICEFCTKTFTRRDILEEHRRTHTRKPEDRFKCEICGHYIADKKAFKRHVKNHATEGLDNTCHYCGKKSPNFNALKRHIKFVHETIASHHCKFCPKSFKTSRDLLEHEAAIHTQQDLYQCEFCQKMFRSYSNFRSHRKSQHPDQYQKPAYLRDDS